MDTRLRGYDKRMMSFPRKRGTKKGDVMGGGMDTRLRGYDIKETGMTKHTMSFPRKRETRKRDVLRGIMDTRLRGYDNARCLSRESGKP